MTDFVAVVRGSPHAAFREPLSADEVAAIERDSEATLPEEFRRALLELGAPMSFHTKPGTPMDTFGRSDLAWHATDETFSEQLPGCYVFGTDRGGAIWFFDRGNRLGRGPDAVHWVQLGAIGFADALFFAPSFGDAALAVLCGHSIERAPYARPR